MLGDSGANSCTTVLLICVPRNRYTNRKGIEVTDSYIHMYDLKVVSIKTLKKSLKNAIGNNGYHRYCTHRKPTLTPKEETLGKFLKEI